MDTYFGIYLFNGLPTAINTLVPEYTSVPTIQAGVNNTLTLTVGDTYTELGATATDDVDGILTDKIITTGIPNTNVAGTYTITYTVPDTSGNIGTATRTVVVKTPAPPPVVTPPTTTPETPSTNTNTSTPTDTTVNNTVQ